MNTVNIALVGLGYWGPNILRNLLICKNTNVKVICDINKNALNKISLQYPKLKITTNYSELLTDNSIDAIIISTPISSHYQLAKEAILQNKNVLVEKPITTSSKEARELIGLAKKHNVIFMAGHTFVYTEAVKKIKSIIEKGELGNINYFDSIRINLGLFQKDSNVIWDLAPHDLSIIGYLIDNKPISLQAITSSYVRSGVAETAHIFINYEKNINAHIHVSWLSPVKLRTLLIGGSKKMIQFNDIETSEKVRIYDKGVKINPSTITPFAPAYRSGEIVIPHIQQREAILNELEHFANCILKHKNPITDGVAGLRVVQLLEAAEKSLANNSIVKL